MAKSRGSGFLCGGELDSIGDKVPDHLTNLQLIGSLDRGIIFFLDVATDVHLLWSSSASPKAAAADRVQNAQRSEFLSFSLSETL